MKLITALILTLIVGQGIASASERIDSISYVFGHQYTIDTMAGKNDLMQSEQDFRDYIRGLEERNPNLAHMNDSSYLISYSLGAMEAIFMTDGIHHKKKEELPPFPCIVAGLRRVGNGNISLPGDTISAMDIINRYSDKFSHAKDIDEDIECKFFTAWGIMKAYQPGLQKYINEANPGTSCVENRQAFATGMADILETYTESPQTAYDMGRSLALSMSLGSLEETPIDYASFVAGAKASLGLGEQIIPRIEVEDLFNRFLEQQNESDGGTDYDAKFEKIADYIEKLEIEPFCEYRVDWKVTACPVADSGTGPLGVFNKVMSELNTADYVLNGALMAWFCDEDSCLYEAALTAIKRYILPDGYKWFCGRTADFQTTIGIMRINHEFVAEVHRASVEYNTGSGVINVQWRFDEGDAIKWATFTESSIGQFVAVEINGKFLFAPRVNQQITGGRCAVADLASEEINSLFGDAEKAVNQEPHDTIEIIELN